MTEEITNELRATYATVHYPDGETEDIEYAEMERYNGTVVIRDIDPDGWRAKRSSYSDNVYLNSRMDPESEQVFSLSNIRKIETNWVEELVAVAEVEVTSASTGFFSSTLTVEPEYPDVTIYQKDEWEAMQDESEQ